MDNCPGIYGFLSKIFAFFYARLRYFPRPFLFPPVYFILKPKKPRLRSGEKYIRVLEVLGILG